MRLRRTRDAGDADNLSALRRNGNIIEDRGVVFDKGDPGRDEPVAIVVRSFGTVHRSGALANHQSCNR